MKKSDGKRSRKKRTYNLIDLRWLTSIVTRVPDPADFDKFIRKASETAELSGCDPDALDQLLFDLSLKDLRSLPPAALRARELPIPQRLIRLEDYSVSLANEKLIHAGQDASLIALVEQTWTGFCGAPALRDHSATLLLLARSADEGARSFYLRVMAGHHRTALLHLRKLGPPGELTMRACLDLIFVQTVIFNARDVQSTIADVHLAMVEPLFGLVERVKGYIRASGINTIFKKVNEDAKHCLKGYMTRSERDAHRRQRIAERRPGKPVAPPSYAKVKGVVAKRVGQLVEQRLAKLSLRQVVKLRRRLDRIMESAREKLEASAHFFPNTPTTISSISRSDGSRDSIDITSKLATAARYSGLGPVECAAVIICRFVQSVVWLGEKFSVAAASYEAGDGLPSDLAGHLPGFDITAMPHGAKTHIKMLLDAYRRVVLEDAAYGAKSGGQPEMERFDNQGVTEIDAAMAWLTVLGPRAIGDFEGDINSERKTFHLLDVLPDVRLSR